MARNKTIRVYPEGNVWVVKKDGAARASAIENTKVEALQAARNIALNQNLTVIVHGKDGRIQRTWNPEEGEPKGNCFLTTACVKYYGLKDDCYQLQTLRKFRDEYLLESSEDQILVKKYYSIAPLLVDLLEIDSNRDILFERIFERINSACAAIQSEKFFKAKRIYQKTVLELLTHFKISS
jgi:hypothetical protein